MAARDLAVVVAGGPGGALRPGDLPAAPGYVVAVDGGLDRALGLGLRVGLVVGDLDSVTPGALAAAEAAGTRVERHAPNKDRTDLELALDAVLRCGTARVLVLGGDGGRFDHVLANALVLASPAYAGVEVDAVLGSARVAVVRDRRELRGRPGDLVSLLPVHGPARGVRTQGLAYVLADEDLEPGSTRGVSNVFAAATAAVSLRAGTLLAVQPRRI